MERSCGALLGAVKRRLFRRLSTMKVLSMSLRVMARAATFSKSARMAAHSRQLKSMPTKSWSTIMAESFASVIAFMVTPTERVGPARILKTAKRAGRKKANWERERWYLRMAFFISENKIKERWR